MHYPYLTFLAIFFAIPAAILCYIYRKEFHTYRRTLFWCFVAVYTLGIFWDWLSVHIHIWDYHTAPTLGVWVSGLPVEEFIGFNVLSVVVIFGVVNGVLKHIKK